MKMRDGNNGGFNPLAGIRPISEWKPEAKKKIANVGGALLEMLGQNPQFAYDRAKEFGGYGLRDALAARGYDKNLLAGFNPSSLNSMAGRAAAPSGRSLSAATVAFPKIGSYRDGMRYNGGNPNDSASWQDMGQARSALIAGIAGPGGDTSLLSTFSIAQLQKLAAEQFGTSPAANDPYANLGQ
ncbi:MAG: hypothetical protein GXP05_11705 [Alphaproteobacteria bacterium]|nr:hypothetical protein [Alphaproteobacteria bacterium]